MLPVYRCLIALKSHTPVNFYVDIVFECFSDGPDRRKILLHQLSDGAGLWLQSCGFIPYIPWTTSN